MKTLYLCYFSLREPLVQTQVLPYLRQLVAAGIDVKLLTFEPQLHRSWPRDEIESQVSQLAGEGIGWFRLAYHKCPSAPATAYDIAAGAWAAARLARRFKIDVLHARSHVPVAMALLARGWAGCSLIFDIRGLWAEEYVDIGNWREGSLPYRVVKKLERVGIGKADRVVVLTRRMRDWLVAQRLAGADKIEVIPCCTSPSRFAAEESGGEVRATPDRFEVVYAGTATGLHLLEEMGHFFLKLKERRPDAFLRILTGSDRAEVSGALRRTGLNQSDFWVGEASPTEVPRYFHGARLGLSFRKPTLAQIAASPAKIPEYLAAGLPVVANAGIGDSDELLSGEGVGVVLADFSSAAYEEAAARVLALAEVPDIGARCRRAALRYFDLVGVGGARYINLYRDVERKRHAAGRDS